MRWVRGSIALAAILAAAYGCGSQGSSAFLSGQNGGNTSDPNANSVADVTAGGSEGGTEFPVPSMAVRARVRNESSVGSDMTVKFRRGDTVVNQAFIRVLPSTITTVTSPESAESVEISGVDGKGHALALKTFAFGIDFQSGVPAEYVISDPNAPPSPPDGGGGDTSTGGSNGGTSGGTSAGSGGGSNPGPPGPPVPPNPPPTGGNGGGSQGPGPVIPALSLLEPSQDVTVFIGNKVHVRWDDTTSSLSSRVSLFLRPTGDANEAHWVSLGPEVGALLDGVNDELDVLVEGVDAGSYEIAGVLSDSASSDVSSVAPGTVTVQKPSEGVAPTITVTPQSGLQAVHNGDKIVIHWTDEDSSGNATITFSLESTDSAETGVQVFTLSPTFAEDPDGDAGDSANITINGVIPGTYDLVALISDNGLSGSDRLANAVQVLPDVRNDPPTFSFLAPAQDIDVAAGQPFDVRWTDSDANDNAQISFLLDPDWQNVPLNGNEYLLASSISEDPDGVGDQMQLELPRGLPNGFYVLVSVINDGLIEVQTRAQGFIYVGRTSGDQNGQGGNNGQIGGDVGSNPVDWLTSIEPFADVVDDVTEKLTVHFLTTGPIPVKQFLFVSNVNYGGASRVDVTPIARGSAKDLYFSLDLSSVPNDAWPRTFDIESDLEYADGTTAAFYSVRPIKIRQQVEVVSAVMYGYSCSGGGLTDATTFVGLELTWFGGGFEESDSDTPVDFWLTKDGTIPSSNTSDASHRRILQSFSSPNVPVTSRIPIGTILGTGGAGLSDPTGSGGVASVAEPGNYQLFSVFSPLTADRFISEPFEETITLCGTRPAAASKNVP